MKEKDKKKQLKLKELVTKHTHKSDKNKLSINNSKVKAMNVMSSLLKKVQFAEADEPEIIDSFQEDSSVEMESAELLNIEDNMLSQSDDSGMSFEIIDSSFIESISDVSNPYQDNGKYRQLNKKLVNL